MLISINLPSEILGREGHPKHTTIHVAHVTTTSEAVTIGLKHCLRCPQQYKTTQTGQIVYIVMLNLYSSSQQQVLVVTSINLRNEAEFMVFVTQSDNIMIPNHRIRTVVNFEVVKEIFKSNCIQLYCMYPFCLLLLTISICVYNNEWHIN